MIPIRSIPPQVQFQLRNQEGFPLPPGIDSALLAEVELTGLDAVKAKYNNTGKISVTFR